MFACCGCRAARALRAHPPPRVRPCGLTRATYASHPPSGIFGRSFHLHSVDYARETIAQSCSLGDALATAGCAPRPLVRQAPGQMDGEARSGVVRKTVGLGFSVMEFGNEAHYVKPQPEVGAIVVRVPLA